MKRIAYKVILWLLTHQPKCAEEALFFFACPIYKLLHKKRAWGRVQNLLHLTGMDEKTYPRAVFKALYTNYLDSLRFLCKIPKTIRCVQFQNEEVIREPLKNGIPIVAISVHQGAFEILHRILTRYSDHVYLFTHSFADSSLTELLHEIRQAPGLKERETNTVAHTLREFLQNHGVLAMLVDQATEGRGNPVQLLGKPAELFLRLPLKAMAMGAGIVTFRTFRTERGHLVQFESYYPPKSPQEKTAASIAAEVSRWIQEHPSDWTWNYHRNFTQSGN